MLNMYNPPKRAKINDVITFTDILDSWSQMSKIYCITKTINISRINATNDKQYSTLFVTLIL
jgi:hypothetical protein